MNGPGKSIFCIIEAAPWEGIGENGTYAITYRDLAAVVRDCPLPRPKPSREELVGHLRVIEQVMAGRTVIPVAYGTVAVSEEEVREVLLASRYEQLRPLLRYLDSRVELGLKVLWKETGPIFAEIVAEHERIRTLRDWIAGRPEAHTRQERIELGKRVADALEAKKRAEAQEFLDALALLAVEARTGQLLGEKMILNAAFLVDRKREAEFDEQVAHLSAKRGERLAFRYVGPVPPFNFVTL